MRWWADGREGKGKAKNKRRGDEGGDGGENQDQG